MFAKSRNIGSDDSSEKKKKQPARGCVAVFGLPFLLMGLFVIWTAGFRPILTALDVRWNWVETPCSIVRSEVSGTDKKSAKPEVAYAYTVNGTGYTATETNIVRRNIDMGRAYAREFVARHPAGKTEACRVNPKAPSEATIEYGIPSSIWMAIPFGGVFAAVGGGLMLFGSGLIGKNHSDEDADENSATATPSKPVSRIPGILFGLVFFTAGAGVMAVVGIRPAWKSWRSASWEKVPCHIVSSEVGRHSGKSTTYSVDIEFDYAYRGENYRSETYDFRVGASSGYDDKRDAVAAFPAGSDRTCLVNPANPREAVLSRHLDWTVWAFGFGLGGVFALIGGFVLWGSLFGKYTADGSVSYEKKTADGRILLKPEMGPVGGFIALLFFALLWNGFISIPISQVVKSFVSGNDPQWGLALVMSIFAAIGIVILGITIKAFLGLFSPRILLDIDRTPAVGDKVTLNWRIQGDPLRLRSLAIALEVYREVTTGSGKGRKTHKEILSSTHVRRHEGVLQESGYAVVEIPAPPAGVDKLKWRFTVRADVARGVNVATDHPFQVLPAKNPFA